MSQNQLDIWRSEYKVEDGKEMRWSGYKDLGDRAGETHEYSDHLSVRIDSSLEGCALWSEVVLWHEFCHCWAYRECDRYFGHGGPWLERMLRRPVMFALQVPCVFVVIIRRIIGC